ncbi:MAG: peptide deformylase [Bacteroidota bacterium]
MSTRPIYLYGSDVLHEKARPVKELNNDVVKLIVDLVDTMHKAGGIGLAANQVGELHRVIVIDMGAVEEALREETEADEEKREKSQREEKTLIVINPEILHQDGSWKMEEGCLSLPDIRADVERAEKIRARFRDGNFREVEIEAEGLLARVLLHELDHLNGVLFINHLSSTQRALLKPRLRKMKKGDVETSYPVVVGSVPPRQTNAGLARQESPRRRPRGVEV